MANSQQFCTFFLRKQFFGVPVERVQEVIRYQEMTRVPLVPEAVRGLINLRGQIVTAIDLRRCLGMPEREVGELPMNVVVRTAEGAVSLLVDEISDVLEVGQDAFETPPETLVGPARALVRGVYKLPGQLLLELDIAQALAAAESRAAGQS
jgi:purine-binding chemotaxis protein CheW